MPQAERGTPLNQSVVKAVCLLRAAADEDGANVSELARKSGIPRATTLRLVATLEHEGFVMRAPGDDRVFLGPELLRLARGTDVSSLLADVARPVLGELAQTIGETVTLSVCASDGGLDLIEQVDAPHQQLRPRSWVGQRFPLHCSATGKLLLASMEEGRLGAALAEPLERYTPSTIADPAELELELARVRTQRHAIARDEEEEGLTGIGAGVYSPSGELLGVVAAAGPTQRLDRLRGQEAVIHLLRAARSIEAHLSN